MAPAPRFSAEEQERLVINSAIAAINESSLFDFSMSAIAKLSGLSMGSVYKFVQCKEDVLIALATRMYLKRQGIYTQILALPLTTPERIIASSLLNFSKVQMYSFDNQLESIVNTEAMMKRCSARWLEQMTTCGERCQSIFQNFLQAAANSGELTSGERDIEEINLGIWSLSVGYFQTVHLHHSKRDCISSAGAGMTETQNEVQSEAQTKDASEENTTESCFMLAPDDLHIKNMKRLVNSYDWQVKVSDEDILNICQKLTEAELR